MSPDELVGPPNALRWVGRPSDHNGYLGVRVKDGLAILRSGTGHGNKSNEPDVPRTNPQYIVCKDAFSGVTLWSRRQCTRTGLPRQLEWGVIGQECLFLYTLGSESRSWGDEDCFTMAIEA